MKVKRVSKNRLIKEKMKWMLMKLKWHKTHLQHIKMSIFAINSTIYQNPCEWIIENHIAFLI